VPGACPLPACYKLVAKISCFSLLSLASAWSQQSTADKLLADGHYRRAQPVAQAALQKNPQDMDALIALSTIQWAYGQLESATAMAEKAVLAANESAIAHAQLANILGARLASSKTGTLEKISLARRFHKEADRTLALDPNNLYAHEALARFYWYGPPIVGGDKANARHMVDRLIILDSTRGFALKAELDATNSDKAKGLAAVLEDWKQAVTAAPGNYTAHAGLSTFLVTMDNDKLKWAEDEAKRALAIDPSRIAAYRLLAELYVLTGQWEKLDAVLKRARIAIPDDPSPDFTAAQTIIDHNMQSQFARAEAYLRNYLSQPAEGLEPTTAVAHWRLGQVLEKEGRRTTALTEVQTAVNLDPSLDGARKDMKRLQ